MANNDIKQKIILDGEQEYRNAIRDAQRNLRTLRSELKAETAEMGRNATEQQKNEAKVKSLKKQIQEQEKIVKANKAALEEVRQKYGDNAEAIAKYEQKLNESRTALANMKNELEGVGQGMKKVQGSAEMATVATKSVADTFEKLSGIGDTIASGIETAFTGMLSVISSAVTEIWSMIADTAAKANNWTDLASYYGTTAEEIERINAAVEWSQGNFGNFTNLLNQLSWGGKGQKITEWFGVSDANYDNKLDYAMAVLEKMRELQETDPGKLGDAMEDVFGARKSQQIMWFVSNLDKINENLQEYDEKGYGLGNDEISEMNDVWLELGKIEGKWDKLKEKFAAGFGQVTLDIMTNVNGALDALQKYFDADSDAEREQALKELEENITDAFQRIADAIEAGIKILDDTGERLKLSDNPTARAIGTVLSGLADTLKWFTEDNANNVKKAFEILFGFWLGAKGFMLAAKVASFVKDLKVIQGFKAVDIGSDLGTSVASSFGTKLSAILPGILLAALLAIPVIDMLKNPDKYWGNDLVPEDNQAALEQVKQDMGGGDLSRPLGEILGGKKSEPDADIPVDGAIPVMRTPNGNITGYSVTDEQREGIEKYWDFVRTEGAVGNGDELSVLYGLFADNEETLENLIELIEGQYEHNREGMPEDTPAFWWQTQGGNTGNTDAMTGEQARTMTGAVTQMPAAVARAMSGIQVNMDGQAVGRLVAPYVSQQIAMGMTV